MQGGFRSSRYGSKFEKIKAAAQKDAQKPRGPGEIRDLVKDPVAPLADAPHQERSPLLKDF
jgi:hypothetical protein